jgi:hypothetical protein
VIQFANLVAQEAGSTSHVLWCRQFRLLLALNAIRCGAQNSAAIGDTADITGLEAAGGSIENDPLRKSGGPKCCEARRGISYSSVLGCNPR